VSNLSDLMPAGASGKTIEATATATIASKAPVILNSAGTVTEVGGVTGSAGTPVAFGSVGTPDYVNVVYDTNTNKVVVFWMDYGNSQYGTAAVGTVTGTALSWGTASVFNSAETTFIAATFDSDANKTVTAYRDGGASNYGKAIVGTVDGAANTISFGTEADFNAATTTNIGMGFDSTANKAVIAFRDDGNSDHGTAVVGTVSGTGISFGSETAFQTNQTSSHNLAHDPDENKMILVYKHNGNSSYGTSNVCTITGTSIAFGTDSIFKTANTDSPTVAYDTTANKAVVPYSISGAGKGVVGTVSGTGITFGTEAEFNAGGSSNIACAYDSTGDVTVVSYTEAVTTFDGFAAAGTVSGTSISFGPALNFTGDVTYSSSGQNTIYDPDANKFVSAYRGAGSVVYTPTTTNLTSTNFVGIADAGISTSATGTIVVQGGTVTGMSSLTTGGKYYVQNDGTITSPDGPIAYTIAGASYDSVSFDVTQDSTITGMCFNNDGTKMYVCGENTDTVYQYSLSSAYDLSTASYDSVSLDVSGQINPAPRSVVFNNDGSALYVCGPDQGVFQYTVSTPYDLSTASYSSKTFSVASQELYPCGLIFNNDGASMYVVGSQNKTVYQYTLSTPFDVSTASYASKSMSVTSEQSSPTGLAFNSDGTKIFVIGETTPKINQYSLSSAYDASTGSYDSVSYTYSEGTVPRDIVFNSTGLKFFIPDSGPDDIYQYTVGGGATSSVNAGLAISTTSLLLNGDS
jgi:sugar lactone lactonase YvrE